MAAPLDVRRDLDTDPIRPNERRQLSAPTQTYREGVVRPWPPGRRFAVPKPSLTRGKGPGRETWPAQGGAAPMAFYTVTAKRAEQLDGRRVALRRARRPVERPARGVTRPANQLASAAGLTI